MSIERRFFGGDLRIETRDDTKRIAGYAAVFYDGTERTQYMLWDNAVERILPGAFKRAVAEDDIRGLFNHDPNLVLGRSTAGTLTLAEDGKGLAYEITPGDTSTAKDVMAHLERGDVTGSSFAFSVNDQRWRIEDKLEIREILGVRLYDVGPVTYPAYEATSAGVRAEDFDSLRAEADKYRRACKDAAARGRRIWLLGRR